VDKFIEQGGLGLFVCNLRMKKKTVMRKREWKILRLRENWIV